MFVRASMAMAQRVPGRCPQEADAMSAERPKLFSAFRRELVHLALTRVLQLLCIVHQGCTGGCRAPIKHLLQHLIAVSIQLSGDMQG
jgi:hypothetical protein